MRRTKLTLSALFVAFLLLAPSLLWADEATDAMDMAKNSYFDKKYADSITQLRGALEKVWAVAPLTVRNAYFVDEQPKGYGFYTPRKSDIFEPLEPVQLYCEPIGYTAKKDGDWYTFSLTADFEVRDEKDRVLGGQKNFYPWSTQSRNFIVELMMFFTFKFPGLPSGKYKLMVTLYDQNSTKKTTFEKDFGIK